MLLTVKRRWPTSLSTIGELYIAQTFFCFTLEDVVRAAGVKISGKTAIPAGEYPIIIDFSQRFKRSMPHILNVPMFTGIRIHPLNDATQTEGCIGVGYQKFQDRIGDSKKAYEDLFARMWATTGHEALAIQIENDF